MAYFSFIDVKKKLLNNFKRTLIVLNLGFPQIKYINLWSFILFYFYSPFTKEPLETKYRALIYIQIK